MFREEPSDCNLSHLCPHGGASTEQDPAALPSTKTFDATGNLERPEARRLIPGMEGRRKGGREKGQGEGGREGKRRGGGEGKGRGKKKEAGGGEAEREGKRRRGKKRKGREGVEQLKPFIYNLAKLSDVNEL